MNLGSFIISLITGFLMFLVVFFMGDNSFSVALFCGVLGFICFCEVDYKKLLLISTLNVMSIL